MVKLGKWVQGIGEIPAGGDAYMVHRVLVAGEKPILIQAGTWWGGDGSEYSRLAMVLPNQSGIGAKSIDEFSSDGGAIPIFGGNLEGGFTVQTLEPMFGAYTRSQMGTAFYLPPYCTIVAYANAANTASWHFTLGGFECEDYA